MNSAWDPLNSAWCLLKRVHKKKKPETQTQLTEFKHILRVCLDTADFAKN